MGFTHVYPFLFTLKGIIRYKNQPFHTQTVINYESLWSQISIELSLHSYIADLVASFF